MHAISDAAPRQAPAHHRDRRVSRWVASAWAGAVAIGLSTEYLVQPFVWRHWPVDEVLAGWLEVLASRLVVALCIAALLVVVTRLPARRLRARASFIAAAIVAGAAAGEGMLLALGAPGLRADPANLAGTIVQWTALSLCIAGLYWLWARDALSTEAVLASDLARSTAEDLRLQADLQALRRQIDPHFLFNTLATIKRLKDTDATEGAPLLRLLIEYLRSSVGTTSHLTTLGHEADLAARYLGIVAIRMNGRLTFSIDVPEYLRNQPCPVLAIATLVENAVKHGIAPCDCGGAIAVRAWRDGDAIEIRVEDTGGGIAASAASPGGHGIGLANVRARLHMMYGDRAHLALAANEPRGIVASIRIPRATS
ncbi:MAG: histidine kinase [Burkholderiales bacterium]